MPELPEVQTVVDTLKNLVLNKQIQSIDILYGPIVNHDHNNFINQLINKTIRDIKRRGKYIIFELDDIALVSHLRMEGKYFVQKKDETINKHIHVIFYFQDGTDLRYHDTRKFGRMELMPLSLDYCQFKDLGPEPFSNEFNPSYVKAYLAKRHNPIKAVLLNQNFVAGIGNIYADEILFKCGIHPSRKASTLSDKNILDIIKYTKETLNEAIKAGGTTIRSYTSSLGVTGLFQLSLLVHTKAGDKCPKCSNVIKKIVVAQRGTYICENCQK